MKFLYDFGISQDHPEVEALGLDLEGSNLLCIASGGEIPLSLLAKHETKITAIDISVNQVRLCRLKLASVLALDPDEAASFLGFTKCLKDKRPGYFDRVSSFLPKDDIPFWKENDIGKGAINLSRFERYISIFCRLIRRILGKKRIHQFLELETIEEQEKFFDEYLHKKAIQWIFKVAFSPALYKNRGLDKQALMHGGGKDLAGFFYSKFRSFFTSTPARDNCYLQFYMLGEVIHNGALPAYLQPIGMEYIRARQSFVDFQVKSIFDLVSASDNLSFNNYALSNISDWCDESDMNSLLSQVYSKTHNQACLVMRYIHKDPVNEVTDSIGFEFDHDFIQKADQVDRFPFYTLVKANIKKSDVH